jgi:hypothetical protein
MSSPKDQDEPDRPRLARSRGRKREGEPEDGDWTKVRFGLLAVLAGIGVLLIAYFLGLLDLAIFASGVIVHFALTVVAFLMLLGRLALIGGSVLCLLGPSKNNARIWAAASLVLICLSLLFSCLGGVSFSFHGPHSSFGQSTSLIGISWLGWLSGVAAVSALIYALVFLIYLRALALTIQRDALAKQILYLAGLSAAAVLVNCGAFCAATPFVIHDWTAKPGDPGVPSGLGVLNTALNALGGLLMLVMAAWYAFTVFQVYQAISRRADV